MLSIANNLECVEAARAARVSCLLRSIVAVGVRTRARSVYDWRTRFGRSGPAGARCVVCEATHVLLPSWLVMRRRDAAQVIGEALRLAAVGVGYRHIAMQLGRPEGTVRRWLRAARRRAGSLRACATRRIVVLDPVPVAVIPAGSGLGDAVEAIMLAVRAWVLRFGRDELGP